VTTPGDSAERLRRASALLEQAAQAIERGELDEAKRLEALARAGGSTPDETPSRRSGNRSAPASVQPSLRELLVQGLTEFGWPVSSALLTSYVSVRFGVRVDSRQLASHRRDEARAYSRSASGRPAWLVPALDSRRFSAMRGKLALSAWPLERRIVGPWSERADQLRVTATLAEQQAWLAARDEERGRRLWPLVARLASSVPGAAPVDADFDAAQVAAACRAELELIVRQDEETRFAAASRARAQLDPTQLLWGAELPRALEGGAR